jgi:hypothetical protein
MKPEKSDSARAEFRDREAQWVATHVPPVANEIRKWSLKREGGQPPAARVYLRDVANHSADFAICALTTMVAGSLRHESLTAIAAATGRAIAKASGVQIESNDRLIQVGYAIVSIVCDVTGAAAIVDKHGDRPEKVAGGVKLTPSYELQNKPGAFLEDAALFGAVGMPTFQVGTVPAWTSQKEGGAKGQEEGGMVHSAGKQMRGVTPSAAPALYAAVNAAQRATFRVNPVTAAVIKSYDPAKARAWLVDRLIAGGMDPAQADRQARELARL